MAEIATGTSALAMTGKSEMAEIATGTSALAMT